MGHLYDDLEPDVADEEPVPDVDVALVDELVGAIDAAHFDPADSVTVLHGRHGPRHLAAERSGDLPDLGKPLSADKLPVNVGAAHGSVVSEFAAAVEDEADADDDRPDEPRNPEAREDFYRRLASNPGTRDRSKVNYHGQSVPSSGGGGGTGKSKKLPKSSTDERARQLVDAVEPLGGPRWQVYGLTPGEQQFYDAGLGDARAVVRDLVVQLKAGTYVEEEQTLATLAEQRAKTAVAGFRASTPAAPSVAAPAKPIRWRYNFSIYGLGEDADPVSAELALDVLRKHPGVVRRVLAAHARAKDQRRVQQWDLAAEQHAQERAQRRRRSVSRPHDFPTLKG